MSGRGAPVWYSQPPDGAGDEIEDDGEALDLVSPLPGRRTGRRHGGFFIRRTPAGRGPGGPADLQQLLGEQPAAAEAVEDAGEEGDSGDEAAEPAAQQPAQAAGLQTPAGRQGQPGAGAAQPRVGASRFAPGAATPAVQQALAGGGTPASAQQAFLASHVQLDAGGARLSSARRKTPTKGTGPLSGLLAPALRAAGARQQRLTLEVEAAALEGPFPRASCRDLDSQAAVCAVFRGALPCDLSPGRRLAVTALPGSLALAGTPVLLVQACEPLA